MNQNDDDGGDGSLMTMMVTMTTIRMTRRTTGGPVMDTDGDTADAEDGDDNEEAR